MNGKVTVLGKSPNSTNFSLNSSSGQTHPVEASPA